MKKLINKIVVLFMLMSVGSSAIAQNFVHPGLSHKKSDLDRMKYMVKAKIEPFYSSYQHMSNLPTAKYTFSVQGDVSITTYGLDPYGWKDSRFNDDARAAYYGALRWYIEEDERYAEKAIEAMMAWTGLTDHKQKMSLTSAPIWLMIEAAEIIKHTYDGWAEADIKKFEDMLVYPGYSTTKAPTGEYTWYWTAYKFDQARAGNQELCGVRTVAAIGVFLDNEVIYDRAMRYVSNQPAREDDLPYERGPRIKGPVSVDGSNDYSISYTVPNPENTNANPDWGYCGVLPYNVYPNGQNVESSRDQGHTCFSMGLLGTLGEIAWSQGYDFFGLLDSRVLTGYEYTTRYCVSSVKSFPDQTTPWEPETYVDLEGLEEPRLEDASYDFIQLTNRTKRNKSQTISPIARTGFTGINSWELPIAHYVGRGLKTEEDIKWTIRARDYTREKNGTYEPASTGQDYTGYGALVYHRAEGCFGDPISGFVADAIPEFNMNVVPCVIEAEHYDFYPINAEGKTYHDSDASNTGGKYRLNQGVDIDTCAEGGYQVSSLEAGEWLTYTIAVREAGYYNINLRYAATNADGKIQVFFANDDMMGELAIPFGADYSTGLDSYANYILPSKVLLQAGVMSLKVKIAGASNSFVINSISVEVDPSSTHIEAEEYTKMSGVSVKATTDSEGASHVESFNNRDWLQYDVFIPRTQNYNLLYRLASANAGTYTVVLDNDTIEEFAYNSTGGSTVWESQVSKASISLPAGDHTLKIISNTNGSSLNWIDFVKDDITCDLTEILPFFSISNPGGIDLGTVQTDSIAIIPGYSLQLLPTPEIGGVWNWEGPNGFSSTERILDFSDIQKSFGGTYIVHFTNDCGTITTDSFVINVTDSLLIEAESYSAMLGVTNAPISGDNGNFMVNGFDSGDYVEYEVNVPFMGNYLFDYRVSSVSNKGEFALSVDGSELENISFDATANANTWKTVSSSVSIYLQEGVQTVKLSSKSSGWNLDWIQLNLENRVGACELPFVVDELTFSNEAKVWSSGLMDFSCSDSVNIFINLDAVGVLDDSDYINVFYKIDNGQKQILFESVGSLSATKIVKTSVKGSTIELIIEANTTSSDKSYLVSDIKITVPPVFGRMEAEDFYSMYGIQTQSTSDVNGNENVGWVHNGDWLMFKDVDLTSAASFNVRYSTQSAGNSVEVRLDSETGPLVGKMPLNNTGNWNSWKTQGANILATDGIYDVYFVLKGGDGYLFNVNWFQFSSNLLPFSADATISSTVYPIYQSEKIIMIPKAGSLSTFKANIVPAAKASFQIYKADGVSLAGFVAAGYKVIVTAEDGIHQTVYTLDYNTSVEGVNEKTIKVYPNPAKNRLYITSENQDENRYRVIDMFGNRIENGVFEKGSAKWELDISTWSKGFYVLQLFNDNTKNSIRIIKE